MPWVGHLPRRCAEGLTFPRCAPVQASILRRHPHENIVTFYEPFTTITSTFLPMELCGGDLFDYIEVHGALTEPAGRALFRQVVAALQHCHSLGIYHCDVKPENILLSAGVAKLVDFGSASRAISGTRPCSTILYGCPEALAVTRYLASEEGKAGPPPAEYDNEKADVWSLAVTMLAVMSGFLPFEAAAESDSRYARWISLFDAGAKEVPLGRAGAFLFGEADRVATREAASIPLIHLLANMLHPEAAQRFNMERVADHPWFVS